MKINDLKFKILHHWPVFALAGVVLVLFITNYKPGTFLIGWDNLMPEFYLSMNIKRSIFAVWQEYQSLGLLGGMGHASDLVHQIILLFLSLFLSESILRYVWTFLMLFMGSWGAYEFISFILHSDRVNNQTIEQSNNANRLHNSKNWKLESGNWELLAFLGALFYLLNLATIQTFYAPFESFIAHFAALPWLLFTSVQYFLKPSKRHLVFLSLVLFLATPAAYIPTLFVVYLLAVTILVGMFFLMKPSMRSLFTLVNLYLTIFLVNSFWLLQFIYFTLTNSSVSLNSKINQMSTETIFLQNKEFGTFFDTAQLKGFWFNNVDPNLNGDFTYMMNQWRGWESHAFIILVNFIIFGIILLGVISLFSRRFSLKKRFILPFLLLFIFAFGVIAIDTFPFSTINDIVRNAVPLLREAFRFPFTKFSILAALTYSIFFTLGIARLTELFGKKRINLSDKLKIEIKRKADSSHIFKFSPSLSISTSLIYGFCFFLIVGAILPVFSGNLLYSKERLKVPNSYFQLFNYFKTVDPNTRIADLPQYTFWGWNFYSWGYGGSGFLWYGIEQPILDRAFDVWSTTSENYYYELSHALYSKNPTQLEDVLNKYQISYIVLDKNVINPFAPKSLFYPETTALLSSLPHVKKVKTFGNIDVYYVALKDNPKNFIFSAGQLPTVTSSSWTYDDKGYQQNGNYISHPSPLPQTNSEIIPYNSLFSLKTNAEDNYTAQESSDSLSITSTLPKLSNATLTIPNYASSEKILPVTIKTQHDSDHNLVILMQLKTAQISVGVTTVAASQTIEEPLFVIPSTSSFPLELSINGIISYKIANKDSLLGTTFFSLDQDNLLSLSSKKKTSTQNVTIPAASLRTLPIFTQKSLPIHSISAGTTLTVTVPKIDDKYLGYTSPPQVQQVENCDQFRNGIVFGNVSESDQNFGVSLTAQNATACSSAYYSTLPHDLSYIVFMTTTHTNGRDLHTWVLNEDEEYTPVETYLSPEKNTGTSTLVIPPMEHYGRAYSVHFDSMSIGDEKTQNTLSGLSLYPIPYSFITGIHVQTGSQEKSSTQPSSFTTSHPNESLYILSNIKSLPKTIVLSQSYDAGWRAYQLNNQNWLSTIFPFIFGHELKNHVEINNWENGWTLDSTMEQSNNEAIVIVYLPQYLEYIGFILILVTFYVLFDPIRTLSRFVKKQ